MVFVVCFVIIVILHSVKAVICLFIQKTFTPEISLPKVQEFFFSWWSHAPSITYMYSPWLCTSQLVCVWCKWQDRLSKKKIRSAGFYISRIFNTQPLSRRDLLEGFYTCTKLSRFFFILQQKDDVHKYCIAKIHDYDVNVPFIIYTSVNYFSIPLVIFDRYIKQEEIF